jgi:phage gp29-like protein
MKKTNQTKPNSNVLTAQIIRDDDFQRFLGYMPNPDDIASGSTRAYSTYREMMTDPRIKSLVGKIVTSALNFPIRISQPEECPDDVFQFVRSQNLFGGGFHNKARRILMGGLKYGFSVNEMVWDEVLSGSEKTYFPDTIITRKPDRFLFDYDWNLIWNKVGGTRESLTDNYKWLVFRHEPEDESPYGTSLLRSVYWPWMFKKAGYEFWLQATEKFSVKSLLALFEMAAGPGKEAEVQKRAADLAEMLLDVVSGSASALANVKDVKELGGNGELASFSVLVDACDVQISYGLTGQALATGNPTTGTQALGTVHADMLEEDAKGIAKEVQSLWQTAINWTVELNFGKDVVCPIFEFGMEQWASFDEALRAAGAGIPVSREAFYSIYKIPRPKDKADELIITAPVNQGLGLSESDPKKKRPLLTIL